MKIFRTCDKIIKYSFYLLLFFVPLIMTPFNYELFEFNKIMLVYFLTAIIVSAWLIKMVVAKKFIFRRTFLDIPLFLFLASQFTSTFLSIDRHTSLWGYYSRFNGGLLSTIAYLLLFWAFVSNLDKSKTLSTIRYALISAALVSFYGIAEHFGIDAKYWVQDVQNRVFSTLGQPNWLAAYLVALIPISMAMVLNHQASSTKSQISNKHKKLNSKRFGYLNFKNGNLFGIWHSEGIPRSGHLIIGYLLLVVFYLCLLYTKSRSGLLGFAAAYATFWTLTFLPLTKGVNSVQPLRLKHSYTFGIEWSFRFKSFCLITALILFITFLVGTPWTPSVEDIFKKTTSPQPDSSPTTDYSLLITESGEIRKIVWKGTREIWHHHPYFGTGPETIAYSYYWHRPREHNDISEWDFLYNKAHNEYLNFAANTGTVGLLAYLGVIGVFIFWMVYTLIQTNKKRIKTNREKSVLIIALFSGYCSILVTNFFGFSVVPVALLFFLYPAFSVVLVRVEEQENKRVKKKISLSYVQYLAIVIIIFSLLITYYTLLKFWYADTLFARGEKYNQSSEYDTAFNLLQKAVRLRPGEPFFHNELASSASHLALVAFQQTMASASAQFTDLAITESDQALTISPYHLNFWKNRTRISYTLAEIDKKYNQDALSALLAAVELAPTDAKISYNLGLMYFKVGQEETGIETLEKTIELKPNYGQARYALALFYEQQGKIQEAKKQLEYILEKIDPDYQLAIEKLKEL